MSYLEPRLRKLLKQRLLPRKHLPKLLKLLKPRRKLRMTRPDNKVSTVTVSIRTRGCYNIDSSLFFWIRIASERNLGGSFGVYENSNLIGERLNGKHSVQCNQFTAKPDRASDIRASPSVVVLPGGEGPVDQAARGRDRAYTCAYTVAFGTSVAHTD